MIKRWVVIYPVGRTSAVTGGHKYEDNLWETISSCDVVELHRDALFARRTLASKLLSPLKCIRKAWSLRGFDGVFLNSSTFFYLLPLSFLLKLVGKRVLIVHHHFIYLEFSGLKRALYRLGEWLFLKSASRIVSPSPYIEMELKRRGFGNVMLWPIPFERIKSEQNPKPTEGNLVYVGTIEPRKGLKYLFEALAVLCGKGVRFRLQIIGKTVDTSYEDELKSYARTRNLPVEFLGFVAKETKHEVLCRGDIFVFPSLLEGFGMVLAEAQCYGLPIVCFDNSAMPFTVRHGENGLLCGNGDVQQLAENIRTILQDRALRARMSRRALKDSESLCSQADFKKKVIDDISRL